MWIDPITYCFYFSAITEHSVEPAITQAYLNLLLPCKRWINLALRVGKSLPLLGSISMQNVYENAQFLPAFILNRTNEEFDSHWNHMINALQTEGTYAAELKVHDKIFRLFHCQRKSALGKEYNRLFGYRKSSAQNDIHFFRKNAESIRRLLNCPNETLEGVQVPLDMLNYSLFSFKLWRQNIQNEPVDSDSVFIPHLRQYEHIISIRIPRFIAGMEDDILRLQQLWAKEMQSLGAQYPVAKGSICMDFPSQQHMNAFSCYDRPCWNQADLSSYDQFIPGYAWGMMINEKQARLIQKPENSEAAKRFYQVEKLSNGNFYFQLTPDMRSMKPEECSFLRRFFEPYLPAHPLKIQFGMGPGSFRSGCEIENFAFEKDHPSSTHLFLIIPRNQGIP